MNGTRERRPSFSTEQISLVAYPVENRVGLFWFLAVRPFGTDDVINPTLSRDFNLMFDASPLPLVERGVFIFPSSANWRNRIVKVRPRDLFFTRPFGQ